MTRRLFFLLLLAAALGAAGYAGYRARAQRAAVLSCITALDACLAASNQQRARAAAATVRGIAKSTCFRHHDARDLAVLRRAQTIRARTQSLLDTLRPLRQQPAPTNSSALTAQLPAHLARFTALVEAVAPGTVPGPSSATLQAEGWYGQFEGVAEPRPLAAALLTRLETQLRRYEAAALRQQAMQVGTNCLCFDPIRPLAVPVSATLAPGAEYQAQLFLVLQGLCNAYDAHMTANGRELTQAGHQGQLVTFRVPTPARPGQPDTVRAVWRGRVQVVAHPTDTVLNVTVPYFIVNHPQP